MTSIAREIQKLMQPSQVTKDRSMALRISLCLVSKGLDKPPLELGRLAFGFPSESLSPHQLHLGWSKCRRGAVPIILNMSPGARGIRGLRQYFSIVVVGLIRMRSSISKRLRVLNICIPKGPPF